MATFTWMTSQGTEFEVEPVYEIDQWTGREMRSAERLCGGNIDGVGFYATAGLVFAISIARTVPGYTVDSADSELTFGRVRQILEQMRDREAAERVKAADQGGLAARVEETMVLSPTSVDSEG